VRKRSNHTEFADLCRRLAQQKDRPARADRWRNFHAALKETKIQIDPEQVILVAGTNGKGSVCKALEILLSAAGERVGLFTSPHLQSATERIRCRSANISEAEFIELYDRCKNLVERFSLSHFESLTLMSTFAFFTDAIDRRVDRAVYEVGVGGRWDPTNAIPHSVAVVTRLGLDHAELLGPDLASIAAHKFAIAEGLEVKRGYLLKSEQVLFSENQQLKNATVFWEVVEPYEFLRQEGSKVPTYELLSHWGRAPMSYLGRRGAENLSLALHVFAGLGHDPSQHLGVCREIQWPGRMERFQVHKKTIYLSGDHNLQGVESLAELLRDFKYSKCHILVGLGQNKDADSILRCLQDIPRAELTLTVTPFRGRQLDAYGAWLQRVHAATDDPLAALQSLLTTANEDDLILVTGSLYLVGHVRSWLESQSSETDPVQAPTS